MANRQGEFIWYELMTRKVDSAKHFYEAVVGWKVIPQQSGELSYPTLAAGDDYVGGLFELSDAMCEQGARPTWIGYVGVDNVDSTAAQVEELGGKVLMPARDIPGVGRFAMVADLQHIPFYIMRGASEENSTAFAPDAVGHSSWNELSTPDQDGALDFYGALFGWENKESMPIGDSAQYKFLDHHGSMIGAVSPCSDPAQGMGWTFYFRVADINQAAEKIAANGGEVLFGSHEVPGGDSIIIGRDPEGVRFGLTARTSVV